MTRIINKISKNRWIGVQVQTLGLVDDLIFSSRKIGLLYRTLGRFSLPIRLTSQIGHQNDLSPRIGRCDSLKCGFRRRIVRSFGFSFDRKVPIMIDRVGLSIRSIYHFQIGTVYCGRFQSFPPTEVFMCLLLLSPCTPNVSESFSTVAVSFDRFTVFICCFSFPDTL